MASIRVSLTLLCAGALSVLAIISTVMSCGSEPGGTIASSPPTHTVTSPVTYYVSPDGDDAAAGTSPDAAWRTLGRASSAVLRPGTRLLLQGGERFTGELSLDHRDAGRASDPVVIGSFGGGVATIFSPAGAGISVHDTAGVDIQGLRLAGVRHPGDGDGIKVYSDLPAGHRLDHIVIDSVDVTGFLDGISVGGMNEAAGFGDVSITNASLHGNIAFGLLTFGPTFDAQSPAYANQNVVVSHVVASRNLGDPRDKKRNTGSGIVLGSVSGGSVSWSTASENGGAGAAAQGPAGIWTYDSTEVNIEHDLAYGNKTRDQVDGNGFGLDQNTSNSVLQYNLSYGNDGTGYLVYSSLNNGAQKDNIVRDNVSSSDVRDGNPFYGAIIVIGWVANAAIYQNTMVMKPAATGSPPLLRLGPAVHGISIRNNIFTTESGPIVAVNKALPASAAEFQGNDYYSVLSSWQIMWGQATYGSLSAWRDGTSQEIANGQPTGFAVEPQLVGPVFGLSARTLTGAGAGRGFELKPGSPLIGAGLDLTSLGMQPAATNYLGQTQPAQHPDIGAL